MEKILSQVDPLELSVDHAYQRPLRATYKRIAAQFDPLLVGVITLSRRPNGTLWILDGQHRVAAAKERNIRSLDALIYTGLSLEDEAKVFSLQNLNRIKVSSYDLYNASKMIRGTIFYTLAQIANQVGTPILKITECGPRTIGLYIRKIEQLGAPRTKEVFMVNKLCNKRDNHDLYHEKNSTCHLQ